MPPFGVGFQTDKTRALNNHNTLQMNVIVILKTYIKNLLLNHKIVINLLGF